LRRRLHNFCEKVAVVVITPATKKQGKTAAKHTPDAKDKGAGNVLAVFQRGDKQVMEMAAAAGQLVGKEVVCVFQDADGKKCSSFTGLVQHMAGGSKDKAAGGRGLLQRHCGMTSFEADDTTQWVKFSSKLYGSKAKGGWSLTKTAMGDKGLTKWIKAAKTNPVPLKQNATGIKASSVLAADADAAVINGTAPTGSGHA
jgi:hypothetical protein